MRTITLSCVMVVFACFIAGCNAPDIIVTDSTGQPIEDAVITGTSLSIGGQTAQTDKNGTAKIPWAVQDTKWISVSKSGYIASESIDVSQSRPIKVLLKKE